MIEFFKTLLYIIMVVFFTASMGFSAIHTLHIAIGDPIIINKYIPFIVFVINAIAMFLLGSFYTKNEAAHIKNTVNRDIENKYKDIVDFIKLARYLVSKDTPKIIDDYIEATRKKANLEKLE